MSLIHNNNLFGSYTTRTFADIFPSVAQFVQEHEALAYLKSISSDSVGKLYYLLYARYGNSHIASSDENQFKYKVWSTIFMYGPTWEKRLEVQKKLRDLQEADLLRGSKSIHNNALHPGTEPSTDTLEELPGINSQSTTLYKRSVLEGYENLIMLLETDVTEGFIERFKKLFITVVAPQAPLWYEDTD